MKLLPGLPFNPIGHAPGRPQRGAISQRLRTLFQTFAQLFHLAGLQTRLASGARRFAKRPGALLFPGLMLPADRLAMHTPHRATSPGGRPVKESGSFEPPPFQFIKIVLDVFGMTHVGKLPNGISVATLILCDRQ